MRKLRYTFKNDILFKMLFVQHKELLKELVAALLEIPPESITQLVVLNEAITPNYIEGKFCRLDINMIVNGELIDLEIQIKNEKDFPERVIFYLARTFSMALPAGKKYADLPRIMAVSILDFKLFERERYHSFYQFLETEDHALLSDKMGLHFFELPKVPSELVAGDMRLLWLSLFKAETEEELEKIKALEVPVMNQAIHAYYEVTASPEFRELLRVRERADHDEAQAVYQAEQKGRAEGLAIGEEKGLKQGRAEGLAIGEEKGLKQGRAEGASEAARKLAEAFGFSIEQAMAVLNA